MMNLFLSSKESTIKIYFIFLYFYLTTIDSAFNKKLSSTLNCCPVENFLAIKMKSLVCVYTYNLLLLTIEVGLS